MTFEQAARGRDNNLNLIRFLAASAVLVSHAWLITGGEKATEPLTATLGVTLGTVAVYVFFAISGFLIMTSFDRSRDWREFLMARSLRLFPGLAVSLIAVAYLMGPLVTTLPVTDYLGHPGPIRFVAQNLTLVRPDYHLPGVFETNPIPAVEGSLWTLLHEVACYLCVLGAGLAGAFRRPWLMFGLMSAYLAWSLGYEMWEGPQRFQTLSAFHTLSLPFFIGAAFWVARRWLPLNIVLLAALCWIATLAHSSPIGWPLLVLAIAYASFWLAYVPRGPVLQFNRLGDYSYGIYIYAFPVQGLVAWVMGPHEPLVNVALSFPLTLLCAVLSWHLIEAPALTLRHRFRRRRTSETPAAGF